MFGDSRAARKCDSVLGDSSLVDLIREAGAGLRDSQVYNPFGGSVETVGKRRGAGATGPVAALVSAAMDRVRALTVEEREALASALRRGRYGHIAGGGAYDSLPTLIAAASRAHARGMPSSAGHDVVVAVLRMPGDWLAAATNAHIVDLLSALPDGLAQTCGTPDMAERYRARRGQLVALARAAAA